MEKIILASVSKRRSRILSDCGIAHCVIPSGIEEDIGEGRDAPETVQSNSVRKAEKVYIGNEKSIVIGADTLVTHGKDVIGKPSGEYMAREMLKRFSGEEIDVYTGLCVISGGKRAIGFERSSLKVARLEDVQIERYFRLLGPYDKAGGFSIEGVGALIFDNIRGSYFNILGLPMMKLKELFEEAGVDILNFIKGHK